MLTHTHTEKWPRWPSLIKEIFQEQLTSPSAMLRQDTQTATPHPNNHSCQREICIFAWEEKHSTPIQVSP